MASRKRQIPEELSANQDTTLIYCGPNIPRLGLNHASCFIGGEPSHLEAHFAKCPSLKRLFVPVENEMITGTQS
ncbi:hypothetical protein [Brevibacillus borstelensis]|uniref:hypothetical protein n=1 Tax=Brevibacillus borstelensis TaxID=45462 RepID=UPI0030BF1694